MFTFNLFCLVKNGICFSEIDGNALAYISLNNTDNDIVLLGIILVKYNVSFFFSDLLKNYTLCVLSCNTSEFL